MNTYLLTWNPDNFAWKQLAKMASALAVGEQVFDDWNCANHHVQLDDRLFLLKQGAEPRGLMGMAYATGEVRLGRHYNPVEAKLGKKLHYVPLRFEQLLNPQTAVLLHTTILQKQLPDGPANFTPLGSGVFVAEPIAIGLKELWDDH